MEGLGTGGLNGRGRGGGEGEEESAALANGAFGPDASAMLLDDAAAEGEAEAGAAESARIGGVSLLETLEDVLKFFGGDAASLIFDDEADLAESEGVAGGVGGGCRLRCQADCFSLRRKLDGVGYQFVEHLQDAVFIGKDRGEGRFNVEGDAGLGGSALGHVGGTA